MLISLLFNHIVMLRKVFDFSVSVRKIKWNFNKKCPNLSTGAFFISNNVLYLPTKSVSILSTHNIQPRRQFQYR